LAAEHNEDENGRSKGEAGILERKSEAKTKDQRNF